MLFFWLTTLLILMAINGLISSLECSTRNTLHMTSSTHDCHRTCEYPAKPKLCEYEFMVSWTYSMSGYCLDCPLNTAECNLDKCVTVDGTSRPVIITNGTTPGPSIQVCQGDTIRVKVNNNLQDHSGLSVHWHGLNQFGTNIMDGVSMITQCPIAGGSSFVYKFLADPAGTHWWHSHAGLHRGDGMYGSLIIREPRETEINSNEYDFDLPEHVIQLTEWTSNLALENFALSIDNTNPPNEKTVSLLVNGKGRQVEFTAINGNTVYTPREEFEVEEGMRYRMRIINSAFSECNMKLVIDSHLLNVIASDGYEIQTIINVDGVTIAPGERLDIVLTATAPPSSYCMSILGFPGVDCEAKGSAILRYKDTSAFDPICKPYKTIGRMFTSLEIYRNETKLDGTEFVYLDDTFSLQPVDPDLHNVDKKYYILLNGYGILMEDENGELTESVDSTLEMDHIYFKFPERPLLTNEPGYTETCQANQNRSLFELCTTNDTLCKCTNVMQLKLGEVIEFIIINNVHSVPHPMHMHGHSFRVLAQENVYPPSLENIEELDMEGKLPRLPLERTVIKDTINVPHFGYSIIRWKADNPGYWFFHCHVDYHSESGMAMVIQVGKDEEIPKPPHDFPICGPWSPD